MKNMEKRLKFSTSSLPFEFATAIGESTEVCGETRTCCPKLGPLNFYFWKQFMFVRNASSDLDRFGPFLKVPQQRTARWFTGVCPCEAESQRDSTSDHEISKWSALGKMRMLRIRPVLLPLELCQYPTHLQLRVSAMGWSPWMWSPDLNVFVKTQKQKAGVHWKL